MRVLLFVILALFSLQNNSYASSVRSITVFAEPNLSLVLTKIARIYSQKSRAIISVNLNSSSDLISDIDSGEPADVFISAHPGAIESLRQKGLVDVYNIAHIAQDRLVLATLKTNNKMSSNFPLGDAIRFLDQGKSELIIDNHSSSSGYFSKKFLSQFQLKNIHLFTKLPEDKASLVSKIKNGSQSYTLMLSSQANNESNLKIIASSKEENIFYQAMVIAGDNMEIAREFLKFLKSNDAKQILKENGFLVN